MGQEKLSRRAVLGGAGGLAVMALGGVVLFRDRLLADPDSALRRAEALARRHGLRIVFHGPPVDGASGQAEPLPGHLGDLASAVEPWSLSWALDGIEPSLSVYPEGFYARLCPTLFVVGAIHVDGRQAGGTYGPDWVAVVATAENGRGAVVKTCRFGIHHEFSSLIWHRAVLLPGKWASLLPPGWAFAQTDADSLDAAEKPAPPPTTGFLTNYGATTPENDFNTYAETAFLEPARLMELASGHRLIAAKLSLLLDTYVQVEPRMEGVFRGLGLGSLIGASRELVPGGAGLSPLNIPSGQLVEP